MTCSRVDRLLAAALGLLGCAFYALNVDRELNLAEEGTILYIGERINRGMVLYRDMNHHVSPGVFYLTALLMKIFGTSVMPTRYFMMALFGAAAALVYLLARSGSERPFSLLAAAIFIFLERRYWSVIYYSPIAIVLALLSLACLLGLQRTHASRWALLGGAAAGLVLDFKQDFAVYTAGANAAALALLALSLPARRARRFLRWLLAYGVGFSLSVLPVIAYFALRGALDDIFRYCVLFVIHGFSQDYTLPWPLPFEPMPAELDLGQKVEWMEVRAGLYGALILFAVAACGLLAALIRRKLGANFQRYAATAILAGSLFLGAFPRTDGYHVIIVLPPALVLLAMTLSILARGLGGGNAQAGEIAVFALALLAAVPAAVGARHCLRADMAERRERSTPLSHPRAPVKLGAVKAKAVDKVLRYLEGHVRSGESIFVLPYEPGIYYLSGIDNATRYDMVLPGNVNAESEREIIADLEEKRVSTIVLIEQYHFDYLKFRKLWEYAPLLHRYIYESYRVPADFPVEPTANIGIVGVRRSASDRRSFEVVTDLVGEFRPWLWGIRLEDGRRIQGLRAEPVSDEVRSWWWVSVKDWMLRRVVFMHPEVLSKKRRYVDYRLVIPPGAVLRTGVSLFEEVWDRDGRGVRFEVALRDAGGEEGLFTKLVNPFAVRHHRRWMDYEIDVSRFAGRDATLSLRTASVKDTNAYAWSGFGAPSIVRYPEGADGPDPDDRGREVERVLWDLLANAGKVRDRFLREDVEIAPPGGVPDLEVLPFGDQMCLRVHTAVESDVWRSASIELLVPPEASLRCTYGMASDVWPAPRGEGARFRVLLTDATGSDHVLAQGECNPRRRKEDWRMFPVDADLSAFDGQRVTLHFQTASNGNTNEYGWAVFGEPRLIRTID